MNTQKTDEELAALVQQGTEDAFADIVKRYEDKIIRYAKRYFKDKEDITDLVQDVFVKVYINIQSFNTSQRFSPWIYRIAHNLFVNKIAWKSIRNYISIDADEFLPHTLPSPESTEKHSIHREEKEMLEKHLSLLDDKYKTPVILFFYEDMSYEEISNILKIPTSTVGIRIKRGKEKLKQLLKHYESR